MSLLGIQRVGSGPVLVWLHGFTQTKDSAHQFRSILAGTYELLTLDLPGHGENASISTSLNETADLLAEVLPTEPIILGGYSMGARVALHFALRHRERLTQLLLLSATPGIRDEVERARRRDQDNELANRIDLIGAEAFLDEWLTQSMFASLPHDPIERAARSRDAMGLSNSLRRAGTATQAWLGDELRSLDVPTLIVAGANDAKFVSEARLLHETLPNANVALVANAGHAAHLERPDAVVQLVLGVQPQ
jgi:2-succinyl-6-hydroxy-2,4-cyclohexadiene-1-carboxylate synthase